MAKDEDNPLISIVLPFYNAEDNLGEAIRSVLSQEYKNLELILVDDASTDGSPQIAQRLGRSDARIRVITHQSNQGCGPGRNTGIENARGEYLFFLDSDDILYPSALQVLFEAARDENVGLVIGSCDEIDEQGIISDGDRALDSGRAEAFGTFDGEEAVRRCLNISRGYLPVRVWGILIDMELYRLSGLYFTPGDHEDLTWIPFMYKSAGKVSFIRDIIITYRIRPGSVINSPRTIARMDGYVRVWEVVLTRIRLFKLDKYTREFKIFFIGNLIWILERCPQEKEVLRLATELIRNDMSLADEEGQVPDDRNLNYLLEKAHKTLAMSGEGENYEFWQNICYGIGNEILLNFTAGSLFKVRKLLQKPDDAIDQYREELSTLKDVLSALTDRNHPGITSEPGPLNRRRRELLVRTSFRTTLLLDKIANRLPPAPGSISSAGHPAYKWKKLRYLLLFCESFPLVKHLLEYRIMETIQKSGQFFPEFYLKTYEDLAGFREKDLLRHFVRHGGREGRSPNPYFSSIWYLNYILETGCVDTNPLYHYLTVGSKSGLQPSPDYVSSEYKELLEQYRQVRAS